MNKNILFSTLCAAFLFSTFANAQEAANGTNDENGVVNEETNVDENAWNSIAATNELRNKYKNKINKANAALSQNIIAIELEKNNMTKRLGEIRNLNGQTGYWARAYGGLAKYENYKDRYAAIQIGADKSPDNERFYGFLLGYLHQKTTQSLSSDSFSAGFYYSRLFNSGVFVDMVAKYIRTTTKLSNDPTLEVDNLKFSSNSFLSSFELGYRYEQSENFYIEPSAEVILGYAGENNINTNNVRLHSDSYAIFDLKPQLFFGSKINEDFSFRLGGGAYFSLANNKTLIGLNNKIDNVDTKIKSNSRYFTSAQIAYNDGNDGRWSFEFEKGFSGKTIKQDYGVNLNYRLTFN